MRVLLVILFAAHVGLASTNMQNTQLFTGATNNAQVTDALLSAGSFGDGAWNFTSGIGSTSSDFFRVATNLPYKYPFIAQINNTNRDAVGTNWVYWSPRDISSPNDYERLQFQAPGGSGGSFSNGGIIAYMTFGITNLTGTLENFDLLQIDGSPYTVLQMNTVNGTNLFIAHCAGQGTSTNGAFIYGILTNKLYLVMVFRDIVNGVGLVRMWDPTNNFALAGESFGSMTGTSLFNSWRFWLQANYAEIGNAHGTNWISSPLIFYGNSTNPPSPETNIVLSDFTTTFTPGTYVGVEGGIPVRSGATINVTSAPYNADNTGATDAGVAINTAIAAAASNDVVYLPAGLYKLTTQLGLNADGIELRGDVSAVGGTNTILVGAVVGGHSSSGNYSFVITNGGTKGSTTVMLSNIVDTFGSTVAAGDAFLITALWPNNDQSLPVFSKSFGGRYRLIGDVVIASSFSGTTMTFTKPLAFDFTNSATLKSLNLTGTSGLRFKRGVGFSGITFSGTNSGLNTTAGALLTLSSLRDSYVTNCTFEYLNNYGIQAEVGYNLQIQKSTFRHARTAGTSRSGITFNTQDGLLIQDCIFDDLTVGVQIQGGTAQRVALAYSFFTNISDKAWLIHGGHPVKFLTEGNVFNGNVLLPDNYFSSASHQLFFRNRNTGTTAFKGWASNIQAVGNILGPIDGSYRYTSYDSGYTSPYLIFEFLFPHIGNNGYTLVSPADVAFNFPGKTLDNIAGGSAYTNTIFTLNATVTTNQLWTNMVDITTFTNIVGTNTADGYYLTFQDATDTNRYYIDDLTTPLQARTNGTSSNLVLNQTVTISNGWKMLMTGSGGYNHLQTNDGRNFILHGNLVYTNSGSALVWDATRLPRVIRNSWLYDSAPVWFGTNRWPPLDPLHAAPIKTIPAEDRYVASGGSGGTTNASYTIRGATIIGGRIGQ